MKFSTKLLFSILGLGLFYSFYKMFTGQGGSGLGDFIDALTYTSIILFLTSFIIIVFHIRQIKKYADTFLFLLLGLPMTMMAANGLVQNINSNRKPDLTAKYLRPFSKNIFYKDSLQIVAQIDSLIALKNRETGRNIVVSALVDTIIYSQSGKQIFVVYAQQFESNHSQNDFHPAYLSANEKDSVYWHFKEGTPNAEYMVGSFKNILDLKNEVRKFYFNQYGFTETDSLKENYFWKRKE